MRITLIVIILVVLASWYVAAQMTPTPQPEATIAPAGPYTPQPKPTPTPAAVKKK